ncbi:uncharacterized protein LOC120321431 [Drosophila yakuba]|uniref:uncharacterized protein LOC120321431 n=1 Tax=Drosophila yakuba TaxID=7245 RepID=UPI001C8A81E7|nr:uncharacterized protein LOC120321431 [Drosophila yakuba]XP_039485223.2 uncharacterized protein LOC120447742 [Drosophila santomea]
MDENGCEDMAKDKDENGDGKDDNEDFEMLPEQILLTADCSRLVCDSYGPVLYVCGAAFSYAFRWYSTINTCLLNGKLQTLNARTHAH